MQILGRRSVASVLAILVNIACGVAALTLALTVVVIAVLPFVTGPVEVDAGWLVVGNRMTIPVSVTLDSGAHRLEAPALGIARAELHDLAGALTFPVEFGFFFLANAALLLIVMSLALWVLIQLRAVLRTVRDGQPFVAPNATRVRRIGIAVIAGEVVRTAIVYAENRYAMTHFRADGLGFEAHVEPDVFAIVLGLIILVIAEVFRQGTRLDEDQSLTV